MFRIDLPQPLPLPVIAIIDLFSLAVNDILLNKLHLVSREKNNGAKSRAAGVRTVLTSLSNCPYIRTDMTRTITYDMFHRRVPKPHEGTVLVSFPIRPFLVRSEPFWIELIAKFPRDKNCLEDSMTGFLVLCKRNF